MKLWLISQDRNNDYDTYDSAVVCANDEEEARSIHPNGTECQEKLESGWSAWVKRSQVKVKYIGQADESIERGVVCASFNAG